MKRYVLNDLGNALYSKWEEIYIAENDRLGGNYAEGNIVEGWCIIDTDDHIKNIEDEIGLLVFGYDDSAIYHLEEYAEDYGDGDVYAFGYTAPQIKEMMLKYFDIK